MCVKNGKLNRRSFSQSVRVATNMPVLSLQPTFLLYLKFFHEDVTDGTGTSKESLV